MTEIKNVKARFSKFTLQNYAFVYNILMDFRACIFIFQAFTTQDFFENVYRLINFKLYTHHSHVTGKIIPYVHNFCNMKVKTKQIGFSCVAYNYLNFDFYFMLRGYRVLCCGEDISISGSNLSNANFLSIGQAMKINDIMKYFQTS